MDFPFFNRPALKTIVVTGKEAAGEQARQLVAGIVSELPDLLLCYVADLASGGTLAAYTATRAYNPHKLSLRNARVFELLAQPLAAHPWLGGPLQDLVVVLDEQLHYLRPCQGGKWYCFVAMPAADANLGVVKAVVRRYVG